MVDISRIGDKERKKQKILEAARAVFCRKGFLAATMRDITGECKISRGGVYLYFKSMDEIFLEVMRKREAEKLSAVEKSVKKDEPFEKVLAEYFARQKSRLQNFDKSLFRAYCEYVFSRPKEETEDFRDAQFARLRQTILSILMLGIGQGVIRNEEIYRLAEHFIVTIDGLSVLALSAALSEQIIDEQLAVLNEMIENLKSGAEPGKTVRVTRSLI